MLYYITNEFTKKCFFTTIKKKEQKGKRKHLQLLTKGFEGITLKRFCF